MRKLSESLQVDVDCGDFGHALDGYPERARELEAEIDRLRIELVQKQEECELPVKYYNEGGVTHAVYGSSSINYVEKLRAECGRYSESES